MISKSFVKDFGRRSWELSYDVGGIVVLIRKKQNGYPKFLEFGINYKVTKVENETIFLEHPTHLDLKKIHYSYILPVSEVRNINLNKLLND